MNPAAETPRETYPWEKRDAREAARRKPVAKEFDPHPLPINERLAPLGSPLVGVTESNHPSFQALEAFRGLIDDQAALDLAGRAAGARSGLYSAPTPLQQDGVAHDYGMLESGTLADLPDLDGYGPDLWQRDQETVTYSDADAAGFHLRDSEFIFYCKNRAGEVADAEAHAKSLAARAALEAQQMDLALGLATQGIAAFLPKSAPRVSIVDPFSEQRLDLAPVRRVNFFPAVAKARRASMLTHLNAWVESHPLTRMLTFTGGQRVRLDLPGQVRGRFQFIARRISNLNAHPYLRRIGCRFSFRASEAGTLYRACPFPREPGTENGVIYAHIHAHVFANFDHQLSPSGFKKFLRRVKSIWRHHWDFGRTIADPAEACKYPVKPGDLAILTDPEKAAWYRETRKLHIVQPLGELREAIAARHEAALKGRQWRTKCKETGKSTTELRFRPDWNARPRISAAERNARAYQAERIKKAGLFVYGAAARLLLCANSLLLHAAKVRCALSSEGWTAIISTVTQLQSAARALLTFRGRPQAEKRMEGIKRQKQVERDARPQIVIRNRVCARLGPAPMFDRVFRPALVVWNFDGDYAALRAMPFVCEYGEAVAGRIAAAEAQIRRETATGGASSTHRVHTSHITAVRARGGADPAQTSFLHGAEAWTHPPDPKLTPADLALSRN